MKKVEEPPRILRRSERIRKLQETQKDYGDNYKKPATKASSERNAPSALKAEPLRRSSRTMTVSKTLKRKASDTNNASSKRTKASPAKGQTVEHKKQPKEEFERIEEPRPQTKMGLRLTDPRRVMPQNVRIKAIREAIRQIPGEEELYSDPQNFINLVFPYIFNPRGLKITKYKRDAISFFPFMGRKPFADMLQWYRRYSNDDCIARRLVLYGPSGCGKNSLLTALACYLTRLGHHVIYVPNCYTLAMDFIGTMVAALYLAIPEDLHSAIDALRGEEDIVALVNDFKKGYFVFILPDWDTFIPKTDRINADMKARSLGFVNKIICNHYTICSVSWSNENHRFLKSKELEADCIDLVGGFNDEEMECWWGHNSESLPVGVSALDKEKIQYYTGCLPSHLKELLSFSGRVFSEVEKDYWENDSLSSFRDLVQLGIEAKTNALSVGDTATQSFMKGVKTCLQEAELDPSTNPQDRLCSEPFFYFHNGAGRCLTGDTREITTEVLVKRMPTFLDDDSWVTLLKDNTNSFVKKFFLTQICLIRIATYGLVALDNRLKQMPFKYYHDIPQWSAVISQEGNKSDDELRHLFVRSRKFCSPIDGIAVILNKEENMLDLFFFQIASTIGEGCFDGNFYPLTWKSLRESLARNPFTMSYGIRSTYVFLQYGSSEAPTCVKKKVTVNRRKIEYTLCRNSFTIVDNELELM